VSDDLKRFPYAGPVLPAWIRAAGRCVAILLVVLAVTGCASFRTPPLPSVTGAGSTQIAVGKFVWRDLLTRDPAGAKTFYGTLFDWQFRETGDTEYSVITSGGRPIGGIALHRDPENPAAPALWLSSLSIWNVDAAVDLVEEGFGSVLEGPGNAGSRGRVAIVRDPAGAPLALIRAEGGDPLDGPPVEGSWVWTELLTHDVEEAETFYRSLVGYSVRTLVAPDGRPYRLMVSGGIARAGLVALPWREIDPHWLPYVAVRDLDKTLRRAIDLGGRLVLGPELFGGDERVAVLADPAGGAFGVQELPSGAAQTRFQE
jgi:predicted enzyme related to lactoylglutathione lyase